MLNDHGADYGSVGEVVAETARIGHTHDARELVNAREAVFDALSEASEPSVYRFRFNRTVRYPDGLKIEANNGMTIHADSVTKLSGMGRGIRITDGGMLVFEDTGIYIISADSSLEVVSFKGSSDTSTYFTIYPTDNGTYTPALSQRSGGMKLGFISKAHEGQITAGTANVPKSTASNKTDQVLIEAGPGGHEWGVAVEMYASRYAGVYNSIVLDAMADVSITRLTI